MKIINAFLLLFFFFINVSFANVPDRPSMWAEKTNVVFGDTVNIKLFIPEGISENDVDFLESNARIDVKEILQETKNPNVWVMRIKPLMKGKVFVPAIKVGQSFASGLELNVVAASIDKRAFIEASLIDGGGQLLFYQGGMIKYKVTIYSSIEINGSLLMPPKTQDFEVVELEIPKNAGNKIINGIQYNVYQVVYGLFPKVSGKLDIPPTFLKGDTASGIIEIKSNELTINVNKFPLEATNTDYMLVSSSVEITDSFNEKTPDLAVNTPVPREIAITAVETIPEYIPEINVSKQGELDCRKTGSGLMKSIINGQLVTQKKLSFLCTPLKEGVIELPPLKVTWWNAKLRKIQESYTKALSLKVMANLNNQNSNVNITPPPNALKDKLNYVINNNVSPQVERKAYLKAFVDNDKPYVQERVNLTLRFYDAIGLLNPRIIIPQNSDFLVQEIQTGKGYRERIDDVDYFVTEINYAIFPQKSGDLEFPSVALQSMGFFGGYSGQRNHQSNTVKLDVKPKNSKFINDIWLPAKNIKISEDFNDKNAVFQVGAVRSLKTSLEAEDLMPEQLPDISYPSNECFEFFPDKVEKEKSVIGNKIISKRINNFIVKPIKSGICKFPQASLKWWDTNINEQKTAKTIEKEFTVLSANVDLPNLYDLQNISKHKIFFYAYYKLIILIVIVIILFIWRIKHYKNDKKKTIKKVKIAPVIKEKTLTFDTFKPLKLQNKEIKKKPILPIKIIDPEILLKKSCLINDINGAHKALIKWGEQNLKTPLLQEIGQKLGLNEEISLMNDILYGKKAIKWNGQGFLKLFQAAKKSYKKDSKKKAKEIDLPELY